MFIHSNQLTTICQHRCQPVPLKTTACTCTRVVLAPSLEAMPQPNSCRAKLGRGNSILARQQGSDCPLRPGLVCMYVPSWGPAPPACIVLLGRWLAGWPDGDGGWGINILMCLAMTRLPAALRNLVKLNNGAMWHSLSRGPWEGKRQLPSRRPVVGKRLLYSTAGRVDLCSASAAKPRSHDGHTMPCWKGFLALGNCA